MLGAHITKKQFLAMWKIKNLDWIEYLTYNIIYGYIWYNESKGYGVLEFSGLFGVVCIEILLQTGNWILQLLPLPSNCYMWTLELHNDAN